MQTTMWRTRWAAVGAAIAVILGAGGIISVGAASDPSAFVAVEPTRVLDTRIDIGLAGPFTSATPRDLKVTGTIPTAVNDVQVADLVVPDGATSIVANVTAVGPTTAGFVAVRPSTSTGNPSTSNINFTSGGVVEPNSVTVELPTSGPSAGAIELWFQGTEPSATTDLLVDIVGYHVAGAPGPKGDQGDPGARGFSAWDTIPSGVTVTGYINQNEEQSVADDQQFLNSISYPGLLPEEPISANFAADASAVTVDDDPSCTGSFGVPTAPPGQVCAYYGDSSGIDGIGLQPPTSSVGALRAVNLEFYNDGVGKDTFLLFSWAYTAP